MYLGVKDPTAGGEGEDAQPSQAPRARSGAEPDPQPEPEPGGPGGFRGCSAGRPAERGDFGRL